ncbi:MAG: DNA (cytosine-5-)-methyltransferase [Rickettsiales bacterium]|jgi:DNA (cytosine-5)-methyltransferase 1|nr:DNA (cytosine-5-)-methyltransferase [Rickettsiales bacterium]
MGNVFIDLFCGIGGFRIALEKRGLKCVFSCDIDPRAREAYRRNFGDNPSGDITEIDSKKIPKHDILCAGFPCQSFSIAGKMGGIADPRGRLFYEILRIAEYRKPGVLLLENVKNILTIDGGNAVKIIEEKLNEIGYDLYKRALNASHFGIPQARERVYFVALKKEMALHKKSILGRIFPRGDRKKIFLKDILENNVDKSLIVNRKDIKIFKNEDELESELRPIKIGIVNKGGQGERIYSSKGHAVTQSAYGGGVGSRTGLYSSPQGIRRLTIGECKRVMGFPAEHIVSDGMQGYQQLGNAVIPDMIGRIFDNVRLLM